MDASTMTLAELTAKCAELYAVLSNPDVTEQERDDAVIQTSFYLAEKRKLEAAAKAQAAKAVVKSTIAAIASSEGDFLTDEQWDTIGALYQAEMSTRAQRPSPTGKWAAGVVNGVIYWYNPATDTLHAQPNDEELKKLGKVKMQGNFAKPWADTDTLRIHFRKEVKKNPAAFRSAPDWFKAT